MLNFPATAPVKLFSYGKYITNAGKNTITGASLAPLAQDTFSRRSSDISFGSIGCVPYFDSYPENTGCADLDEDFLTVEALTPYNIDQVINTLVVNGRVDELAKACYNAQDYEIYDGHQYNIVEFHYNAVEQAFQKFVDLGLINAGIRFLTAYNVAGTNIPVEAAGSDGVLEKYPFKHMLSEADKVIYKAKTVQAALADIEKDKDKLKFMEDLKEKATKERMLLSRKEEIRQQLRPFLTDLALDYCGRAANFPNCIMLVSNNVYMARDTIQWLKKSAANTNFIEVKANRDPEIIQDNLSDALEKAEQEYQRTHKRSIIFVDRLDRIIDYEFNSHENIACMKETMNTADEDYHSTIIFTTKPNKLRKVEPGALQPHRVGLRIDIPITFQDMDLVHV